jgi:hypothetical protein
MATATVAKPHCAKPLRTNRQHPSRGNVVIADLKPGCAYTLQIVTQTSAKHSGTLPKGVRKVRSECKLIAQY